MVSALLVTLKIRKKRLIFKNSEVTSLIPSVFKGRESLSL